MPTALPPAADFTGATVTEGQFKTALTSLRTFLAELLGADGSEVTLEHGSKTLMASRIVDAVAAFIQRSDG